MKNFINIDNLTDAVLHCAFHQNAAAQTFLLSDDQDLSTSALVSKISFAMGFSDLIFRDKLLNLLLNG